MGDPAHHAALDALEAALAALPPPPRDRGTVRLLVRRHADGSRETPERVRLEVDAGLPGDEWGRHLPLDPTAQLAVMSHAVARVLANGQSLELFGDNLFVDLDLTAGAQPPGTELRVGEARVVVTAKPHNGCRKFLERFGADALRCVAHPATRPENRRGVYWRVTEPGDVWVGAEVEVLSRPAAAEPAVPLS